MSDGPHRSLPLRPAWKRFAGCADNISFSAEEVAEMVCPAVADDWRSEIRPGLIHAIASILDEPVQKGFFAGDIAEVARLRARCDSPFAAAFCDAAKDALLDGIRGTEALERAIESSCQDRSLCQVRSVEEHYLRKSGRNRAANVRTRLEEAVQKASFRELSKAIAQGVSTARRFDPPARDGLDDGVQL